jgi:hypothetical protein
VSERHQHIVVAYMLLVLSAAAPLLDDSLALWPVNAIGAALAGCMLWPALADEPIAGPVVVLVLLSLPPMWVSDRLAVGSLVGATLAIVLGEHLSAARASRYSTPGAADPALATRPPLAHGAAAATAIAISLAVTALPEARWLSLAAIAALAVVAAALHHRRVAVPEVELPPPPARLG